MKNIAEPIRGMAVDLATLNHDPANARKHGAKNIDAIKASLHAFGQRKPIVVQRQGMIVRAGNGTLEAAKALGWSHLAAVIIDEDNATASQFAIADNRTADLAEWDDETLASLLDGMEPADREALAFDEDDMRELIDGLDPSEPEVVEDEAPEVPADPVTKTGDLIMLGDHRLMCGDSTKADDVARLMDGEVADAVVSDPPYGMNYTRTATSAQAGMHMSQWRKVKPIVGDDKPFDPRHILKLTKGDILLFGGDWFADKLPAGGSWIVWDKRASIDADSIPGAPFEVCWSRRRQERRFIRYPWGGWNNREKGESQRWHPTQKPVAVMTSVVESANGALVLDPYIGSGTTLIAAEQLGRKCYGMEISPAYCDVIVKRWENLTGKQAVRGK